MMKYLLQKTQEKKDYKNGLKSGSKRRTKN